MNTPLTGACAAALLCATSIATQAQDVTVPKPNVIIIMADDLGYGDLSSYGATLIDTPNIDRIGEEGARMRRFYASANVCTPSRAALLTGRHAIRSGAQFVFRPESDGGMASAEITIAELLQRAGYVTGMIGKWHLGHRTEYWPTSQGFNHFFGVAYSNDMVPFDLYDGDRIVQSPANQTALTQNYVEAAIAFIEANADKPFFLYYAETFPHIPLFLPKEKSGRSGAGTYGDVVENIDDAVGALLAALDRLDIADNTLIIFTSDNGPWFEGSNGALRGRKGGTHLGAYQVPFLARWPGVIPRGQVLDEMAMSIDILPTVARAADIAIPGDRIIDGRDLSQVLIHGAPSPHDTLYFFDGNDLAAVQDRRYRLVLKDFYRTYSVDNLDRSVHRWLKPLLFDLEKDPEESYDISQRKPEVLENLSAKARAMSKATASLRLAPAAEQTQPHVQPLGPQLARPQDVSE